MAGGAMVLALSGCERAEIRTYRIPKENHPTVAVDGSEVPPSTGGIRWTVPDGWKQQPASAMRQASFLVKGKGGGQADMSIVVFPGEAGGLLANVNRWRGQLNLPAIEESTLGRQLEKLQSHGHEFVMMEMFGLKSKDQYPSRLLGAMVRHADQSWFFKMIGDDHLVVEQKPVFVAFLKSVRFGGGGDVASAPAHPSTATVEAPPASPPTIHWNAPPGWRNQPGEGMRYASFTIPGKDQLQADLSVVCLPGTGGGTLANIDMWRSQLALPPAEEKELSRCITKMRVAGRAATLVELVSTTAVIDGKLRARMLVLVLSQDEQTWFFKLTGEDSLVAGEKKAFLDFVKSVRFSNDSLK